MTFDPQPHPPKSAPPGLSARAPRPQAVRLRPMVAVCAAGAAAGLVAGALAWAFVVQPHLRAQARADASSTPPETARGSARPADAIRAQPATYDRLAPAALPPPRGLGPQPSQQVRPGPRPRTAGPSTSPDHALGIQAARSGVLVSVAADPDLRAVPATSAPQAPSADPAVQGGPGRLTAPRSPFEIQAGSLLPAVLLTGVDTARPGPVVASLSEDVFDTVSGRHLLAPRGAKLLGRHEGAGRYGDRRAFVTWDRLLLPNGKSISLAAEPGVDAQGAVGIAGEVDRRLGPLALAALAGGAITTLGEAARRDSHGGGLLGDAGDAAAIDAAQVAGRMVDRELDVKPSIRLDAGARVRVLLTHDLILEPYAP